MLLSLQGRSYSAVALGPSTFPCSYQSAGLGQDLIALIAAAEQDLADTDNLVFCINALIDDNSSFADYELELDSDLDDKRIDSDSDTDSVGTCERLEMASSSLVVG